MSKLFLFKEEGFDAHFLMMSFYFWPIGCTLSLEDLLECSSFKTKKKPKIRIGKEAYPIERGA